MEPSSRNIGFFDFCKFRVQVPAAYKNVFVTLSHLPEPQKRHDFQVSQALLELEVERAKEVLDQM
jgi:hypothetical protein